MKNLQTHSRSSLFLMEIILAVLIFAFTSTACVQIFAASRIQRQKARELNHIQELTTSVGEILEGWDGEFSSFVKLLPPSPGPASRKIPLLKLPANWNIFMTVAGTPAKKLLPHIPWPCSLQFLIPKESGV